MVSHLGQTDLCCLVLEGVLGTLKCTVKEYFQDLLSQHFYLLSNQLK